MQPPAVSLPMMCSEQQGERQRKPPGPAIRTP